MNTMESQREGGIVHAHVDVNRAQQDTGMDYGRLVKEAAAADEHEHQQTFREAFFMHKKAILWSMGLSAALIMEGYDVVVIGSFYGQPNFLKRFGTLYEGEYFIPAQWQSALSNGSSAGGIIGLLLNGVLVERFGARWVMMSALAMLAGFIFLFVFANSLGMLVAAEVCAGLSWGCFQTLTTAYAADICPIHLRGYLTTYINACWGAGILLSSGVVKATVPIDSDWSWRIPFVCQWVWIPPLLVICYFCPESPWWLVRHDRLEEAEHNVKRLANRDVFTDQMAKDQVAYMIHTTEMEKQISEGASFASCFTGINRRRTEIAMMVFAMQLLSGQNLCGQGVQFLTQAGLDVNTVFSLNMVLSAMFCLGTFASWVLISFFGRRTIYLYGMMCMAAVLFACGGMGFIGSKISNQVSGGLLIALNFIYNATLGPVCYTLISEVGSTRLRQKTVALARIAYQIMNIICGIIVPRMLSPAAWNWGEKSGLFWGASATLCCVYIFLRVPETRGRSWGELDTLFENKVPAWRFHKTAADQFGDLGHHAGRDSHENEKDAKLDGEITHNY